MLHTTPPQALTHLIVSPLDHPPLQRAVIRMLEHAQLLTLWIHAPTISHAGGSVITFLTGTVAGSHTIIMWPGSSIILWCHALVADRHHLTQYFIRSNTSVITWIMWAVMWCIILTRWRHSVVQMVRYCQILFMLHLVHDGLVTCDQKVIVVSSSA